MAIAPLSALVRPSALLSELSAGRDLVLLDVRWEVATRAQPARYLSSHLPGAHFCDLDADLADPAGSRGRHPLPDAGRLQGRLRDFGIDDESQVVVYDGASSVAAARAWWVLRWAGLTDVRVLDGGLVAWVDDDGPTEAGPVAPGAGRVTVRAGSLPVVDWREAQELAGAGRLIDVRAIERFGGDSEPIDLVAGHIPGARNVPTAQHNETSGALKPAGQLRQVLAEAGLGPGQPAVGVYCGSGVTAAHALLMMNEAGISGVL